MRPLPGPPQRGRPAEPDPVAILGAQPGVDAPTAARGGQGGSRASWRPPGRNYGSPLGSWGPPWEDLRRSAGVTAARGSCGGPLGGSTAARGGAIPTGAGHSGPLEGLRGPAGVIPVRELASDRGTGHPLSLLSRGSRDSCPGCCSVVAHLARPLLDEVVGRPRAEGRDSGAGSPPVLL